MSNSSIPPEATSVQDKPDLKSTKQGVFRAPGSGNSALLPKLLLFAVVILAVALAALWWASLAESAKLREELAHRLQVGDSTNIETKHLASTVQEGVKELQAKVALLEAKQAETQAQQVALAQLYQDLSKKP